MGNLSPNRSNPWRRWHSANTNIQCIGTVNTAFQRLRPIHIPYGKTISVWAMDWFLIFYLAHSDPLKRWHSTNIWCKHSTPKAQTHSYTLWEHNICLSHGLVLYFLLSILINTYSLVFVVISLPIAALCVPIFFFLMNHTKWLYKNLSQPLKDLMQMFCNLWIKIGGPWHGLQPHTFKNIDSLGLSPKSGPAHEKDGTVPIFNVTTPFQSLRPNHIHFGKILSVWAMDWFFIFTQYIHNHFQPCFSHFFTQCSIMCANILCLHKPSQMVIRKWMPNINRQFWKVL